MKKGKTINIPQSYHDLAKIATDNSLENIDHFKNTINAAEQVIDQICQTGGEIIYEHYLQPKVKPRALEFTKLNMQEIVQQSKWPGDFGEANPVKETQFKEEEWTPEEEPTFVPTYNDNFKPKIIIQQAEETFDNMSIAS